jgi:adenosylcobinamide-GDP ribazoletransferase
MNAFLLVIQLFTKIPLSREIRFDEEQCRKGIVFFPVAGFVIGALQAAVAFMAAQVFSKEISIVAAMLFVVLLTGALHLDGLADTMDGILSARKREQMLLIMKDSRIGTHGVLALLLSLFLKYLFLMEMNDELLLPILMVLPIAGRTSMALMLWGSRYARTEGLGNLFIGRTLPKDSIFAVAAGAILIYAFTGVEGIFALVLVLISALIFRRYLRKLLGGLTGDTLGAINELSELLYLPFIILLTRGGSLL